MPELQTGISSASHNHELECQYACLCIVLS